MKICKKNICYVDLKIYYKITIRGPTLIFADYCLALLGQLLIKKIKMSGTREGQGRNV